MKNHLVAAVAAASLLATPAFAQDPAPAAKPAPPPSDAAIALAAIAEFNAAYPASKGPIARLDHLGSFDFSPATAAALTRIFGSAHPLKVVKSVKPKGMLDYRITLPAGQYAEGANTTLTWSDGQTNVLLDKAGRKMDVTGAMASLALDGLGLNVKLRDMSIIVKQTRGPADMWFGDSSFKMGSMAMESKVPGQPSMTMEGVHGAGSVTRRGKMAEIKYGFSVDALRFGGDDLGAFRLRAGLSGLDIASLAKLAKFSESQQSAPVPAQQKMVMEMAVKDLIGAAIRNHGTLRIEEMAYAFKGDTALVKGQISIKGEMKEAELLTPVLARHVAARFDISLPTAMVTDIARFFARKQMETAKPGEPAPDDGVNQMAQTMTDVVVGKLVNGGYATIKDGVLMATVELKDGKLLVNGKSLDFMPPAPPKDASSDTSAMPARQSDNCVAPPFPEQAVRENQPIAAITSFKVGADGKVRDVVLLAPTAYPDFNAAVIKASEECRWIPALRNGKEVESVQVWSFTRTPEKK